MHVEFSETMTGTYRLTDKQDAKRRFEFTVRVRQKPARIEQVSEIEGTATLEGFADSKPLTGTLEVAPITKRALFYKFEFTGNDGEVYRFEGSKQLSAIHFVRSMTQLSGSIYKGALQIATAQATFDLRKELPRLLASLRLV